jgi:hypothetical protein
MFAKDFIADAAFVALVAWAMTDVLAVSEPSVSSASQSAELSRRVLAARHIKKQHGISKSQ